MITLQQRKFVENLLIITEISPEMEETLFNAKRAQQVSLASQALAKGELSPDDFLEVVESSVPIDDYLDEICDNLEAFLTDDNPCRRLWDLE